MKSKSQKKLLINNKSFDGLFEKEKNKNDYAKIDKQIDFSILPKNNYLQMKQKDEFEELIEKSRAEKKKRFKNYEDLLKKDDEEFKLLGQKEEENMKKKRNSFAKD